MLVFGVALPGQVLIFGDPRVGHLRIRIIDHRDRLELVLVDHLMLEAQASVGQLAEAEAEIFVDRAGEDDVAGVDLVDDVRDSRSPSSTSMLG